jgi:hypothetical protein
MNTLNNFYSINIKIKRKEKWYSSKKKEKIIICNQLASKQISINGVSQKTQVTIAQVMVSNLSSFRDL